jgi:hypothetical protein
MSCTQRTTKDPPTQDVKIKPLHTHLLTAVIRADRLGHNLGHFCTVPGEPGMITATCPCGLLCYVNVKTGKIGGRAVRMLCAYASRHFRR